MQTFVKLMFLLTTYVTLSPTVLRRSSSATVTTRFISRPVESKSATASSVEISFPERALSRAAATTGSALFSSESIIIGEVVLPYQPRAVGYQIYAMQKPFRCNKSTFKEFRIDREPCPEPISLCFSLGFHRCDGGGREFGIVIVSGDGGC